MGWEKARHSIVICRAKQAIKKLSLTSSFPFFPLTPPLVYHYKGFCGLKWGEGGERGLQELFFGFYSLFSSLYARYGVGEAMAESGGSGLVQRFRGRSEHIMDEKGRLNIATRFREALRGHNDERLMVSPWKSCLRAYPLSAWEQVEATLIAEGGKHPRQIQLMRYVIGGVVECVPDRQGRILLPPSLREECGLKKDVVVNGMIAYFEIWDKATWEQVSRPSSEQFAAFEQTWLELGLF